MTDFNVTPYYDDFEAANGARVNDYLRILFKPGNAVQARELTQIQSILQNQLKEFGEKFFQNGAPIRGGQLSLETNVISMNVQPQFNTQDIVLSQFNKQVIINNNNNITANLTNATAYVVATDSTYHYPIMMIKYLRGIDFSSNDTIAVGANTSIQAQLLSNANIDTFSTGTTVSINEGVFFVDGFFAYCAPQTIVLDPFSTTPSAKVGLQISETIVDYNVDEALLDPAQGSFNYQAPGADRYQIQLTLSSRPLDSLDQSSFFELLRIENGLITKQVDYEIYTNIENTLAQRTFDQSGNFTVIPFTATASANTDDDSMFKLEISPGSAYIQGHEFTTTSTTIIDSPKARTTNTSVDYSFTPSYGNYISVRNFHGGNTTPIINVSSFGTFDLHCVPSASINTSSAASYANTLVGTSSLRNISGNTAGVIDMYLLDVNIQSNIFSPIDISSNGFGIRLPTSFSALSNAYTGVAVSVLSGPGSYDGYKRHIVSYDGPSRTAMVDTAFDSYLTSASVVSFDYKIDDVDSLVQKPDVFSGNVYASQDPTEHMFACMDVDPSSRTKYGTTFLSDTNFNTMVFKLPQPFIASGTMTNVSLFTRKIFENQQVVTSNNITVQTGSGESFFFGSDGQQVSSHDVAQYVTVIPKNYNTDSPDNITVVRDSPSQITITTTIPVGQTADVFVDVKFEPDSGTNMGIKKKNLYGNTANTTLAVTDSYLNGTPVTGKPNITIEKTKGYVWYTSSADIVTTPGVKQSLYLSDVLSIIRVYDSGDPTVAPNSGQCIDITDRYYLDSGQNDNYYDHAGLVLRPGSSPPSGQTVVMLEYFDHSTTANPGFFTVDSYTNPSTLYADNKIPSYTSKTYGTIPLRDAIDFRPTRQAGTTDFVFDRYVLPNPDLPMTLTYNYYVSRVDTLIATPDKQFNLLYGTPSYLPLTPVNSDAGMTLYTIHIPAYTANIADIKLTYFENKRYTMKDVGDIDKRVQQLEYYTTLSALEAQTSQQTVLYADQSGQKPCYGIVVDNFSTFDVADNNNVDLICNISQNALSPYKSVNYFNLKLYGTTDQVSVNLTTGKQNKTTHTLAYTETPCVVQNTATTTTGVQPYLFGKFEGTVALTPSVDNWFSKVLRPYVILPNGVFFYPPPLNGPFGIVLGPWVWNYWNSSLYYYNGYYLGEYGLDWVGYGTIDPIAYNYIYRYNNGSSLTVGNGSSQNDVRFIPAGAAGSGVIFNRVVNK